MNLNGKNVCVTGAMASMTRREATNALTKLGANVQSSVTKSTHVLFVGDKPGSKLEVAKRYGIEVKYETDLVRVMVGDPPTPVSEVKPREPQPIPDHYGSF